MNVADLFRQLAQSELRNLNAAVDTNGTIKKAQQNLIIQAANEGLKRLFSRFVLREESVLVQTSISAAVEIDLNQRLGLTAAQTNPTPNAAATALGSQWAVTLAGNGTGAHEVLLKMRHEIDINVYGKGDGSESVYGLAASLLYLAGEYSGGVFPVAFSIPSGACLATNGDISVETKYTGTHDGQEGNVFLTFETALEGSSNAPGLVYPFLPNLDVFVDGDLVGTINLNNNGTVTTVLSTLDTRLAGLTLTVVGLLADTNTNSAEWSFNTGGSQANAGTVIQVTSILNAYGQPMEFVNNPQIAASDLIVVRGGNILRLPIWTDVIELQVNLQMRHPPLRQVNVDTDLTQTIDLIPELEKALTSFIAAEMYEGMNSMDGAAIANNHRNKYEMVCADVLQRGLIQTDLRPMSKLEARGFV